MASIREEIRQTRPFESLSQEAVVSLLRTAGLVRRRFEALCEEYGLTFQQFNVLRILRGAERNGQASLPTMEVAERMVEFEPGITRLIGRLVNKGLVSRERCSEDGRRVLCRLTAEGMLIIRSLDQPIRDLDETILGALSLAELRQMIILLERAREFPAA